MSEILTGSRLPIAQHCGYAFRSDVAYPKRPRTVAADTGVEVHAAMAALLERKIIPVFGDPVAKHLFDVAREWWGERRARPEIAYAYNLDTGKARELGQNIDREYEKHGAGPRDVCCSVDYDQVCAASGRAHPALVGDFKTGWAAHVEPVMENLQLRFAGLCHALVHGVAEVDLEIARIRTDGVHVERGKMTAFELSLTQSLVHEIVERIAGSEPVLGDHCTYCPALGACPATRQGIELVAPQSLNAVRWTTDFLSLQNDSAMVEQLPAVKKALEAIETALKGRYAGGPGLLLPNGKVWKEILSKRDGFDAKKAAELLGDRAAECAKTSEYTQFRQVKP